MIGLLILLVSWTVRLFILGFRILFLICLWTFKGSAHVLA
jgi:hypothetical protein